MRSQLRTKSALGLILLAGAALRLYRLGADSLWYDETVSTYLAGSRLPDLLRHTAGDIHPPGYYLLLRGWLCSWATRPATPTPTASGWSSPPRSSPSSSASC